MLIAEQKSPNFHLSPLLIDQFIAEIAGQKGEVNSKDNLIGRIQNRPLWGGFGIKEDVPELS